MDSQDAMIAAENHRWEAINELSFHTDMPQRYAIKIVNHILAAVALNQFRAEQMPHDVMGKLTIEQYLKELGFDK